MKAPIAELLPALRLAKTFTDRSRTGLLPIYGTVKLDGNKVEAFNGECGIVHTTTVNWDIKCAVPVSALVALLEKLEPTYAEATLETATVEGRGTQLLLKAGTFSATIPVFPLAEYPSNGLDAKAVSSVELDPDFLASVRNALFCCATDLAQTLLGSVALRGTNVYAAEARRMYVGAAKAKFDRAVILSRALAEQLLAVGDAPTKVDILDGRLAFYGKTSIVFGARLADDERYPDFDGKVKTITTAAPLATAVYDAEKLRAILARLLVVNNDNVQAIELTFVPGKLLLANKDGTASETLDCDVKCNEPATSVFGGRLLVEAVERFASMRLHDKAVEFKSPTAQHLIARLVA